MSAYSYGQLNSLYQTANGLSNSSHTQIMAAIAVAESSGNPSARNASGASGLWQIMPSHVHDAGWSYGSNFFDPATNARMAEFVYKHQGYTAWTTFSSGAYKKFLGGSTTVPTEDAGFSLPSIPNPLSGLNDLTQLLTGARELFDAGFWRRVGIGLIGLAFVLVGLIIILRRPIESAASVGVKAAVV